MTRLPGAGQEPGWLQADAAEASRDRSDALHQQDRAYALRGRRLGWGAIGLACGALLLTGTATDGEDIKWFTAPIAEAATATGSAIDALIPGDIPLIGFQDPISREDQIQRNMPDEGIRNSAALPDGTVVFLPPSRAE